jgi:hypothetical protein
MFGIPTVADMAAAAAAAAQSGSQQHQLMQHFYRLNQSGTATVFMCTATRVHIVVEQ